MPKAPPRRSVADLVTDSRSPNFAGKASAPVSPTALADVDGLLRRRTCFFASRGGWRAKEKIHFSSDRLRPKLRIFAVQQTDSGVMEVTESL